MAKNSRTNSKKPKRPRARLPPTSEEMKVWSALLGQELKGWPHVTTRPMFGLLGFYRRKKIFAALPVTRGFNTPNSLIFRIKPMPPELLRRALKEPRIDTESRHPDAKWLSFEVHSAADLRAALWWLNQAYERAK
jgi:hypothetical protein